MGYFDDFGGGYRNRYDHYGGGYGGRYGGDYGGGYRDRYRGGWSDDSDDGDYDYPRRTNSNIKKAAPGAAKASHASTDTRALDIAWKDRTAYWECEYAASSRAECRFKACGSKIGKDEVRIGVNTAPPAGSRAWGRVTRWYHLECCFKSIVAPLYPNKKIESSSEINGFGKLKDADQKKVLALIASTKATLASGVAGAPAAVTASATSATQSTASAPATQSAGAPKTVKAEVVAGALRITGAVDEPLKAELLARKAFFDGGERAWYVMPSETTDGHKAALAWLATKPEVDVAVAAPVAAPVGAAAKAAKKEPAPKVKKAAPKKAAAPKQAAAAETVGGEVVPAAPVAAKPAAKKAAPKKAAPKKAAPKPAAKKAPPKPAAKKAAPKKAAAKQ